MPLSLKTRFCGDVCVIHCKGRIVMGDEAKSLETALDLGSRETSRIVLCVSEVDRLDSIGIGLLVRYVTKLRKRGGDLRLAAATPLIVSLLKLTSLSDILHADATEHDAILSFLKQPSAERVQEKPGHRVLVVDQSTDLCAFVKTVLTQHGFSARTANYFHDAKILLQVDQVDYILIGPDSPELCFETVLGSLKTLAPKSVALQLDADFKERDALEATEALLQLFGARERLVDANSRFNEPR